MSAEINKLLSHMNDSEIKAAQRFHETIHDDGTYDISKNMRKILQSLGLIKHSGGGIYHETDLMLELIEVI